MTTPTPLLDTDYTATVPNQVDLGTPQIHKMERLQTPAAEGEQYLQDLVTPQHYHRDHKYSEGTRQLLAVEELKVRLTLYSRDQMEVRNLHLDRREGATPWQSLDLALLVCAHE
jgi:hypothetical protein